MLASIVPCGPQHDGKPKQAITAFDALLCFVPFAITIVAISFASANMTVHLGTAPKQ